MANSELDRLLAQASGQVSDLIRRAYEAGVRQERARLTAIINADLQQPETPAAGSRETSPPEPARRPAMPNAENYGKVIGAVRNAFRTMQIGAGGIDAGSILRYLNRAEPELHINDGQVRTALKQLLGREEVVRVDRGRFRLARAASPGEGGPGDSAPGHFRMAAE